MGAPLSHTLSKEERLCGRNAVSALLAKGRYGVAGCLKYCFLQDNGLAFSRILISVPKRSFKRAVKRNLLKRRLRESYRLQKELLAATGVDLLLAYSHPEVADSAVLFAEVTEILQRISAKLAAE